jgi:6-phosphogluconolactonase
MDDPISRRTLLRTLGAASLTAMSPFTKIRAAAARRQTKPPLLAYVGTFSSPLKDTLPTQVDLPPGNGRGIHIFRVDRSTGAMTPSGIVEMGTSPNCLALNATRARLYTSNETDRVGEDRPDLCQRASPWTSPAGGELLRRFDRGAPDSR